jgi:hypothetical protein
MGINQSLECTRCFGQLLCSASYDCEMTFFDLHDSGNGKEDARCDGFRTCSIADTLELSFQTFLLANQG